MGEGERTDIMRGAGIGPTGCKCCVCVCGHCVCVSVCVCGYCVCVSVCVLYVGWRRTREMVVWVAWFSSLVCVRYGYEDNRIIDTVRYAAYMLVDGEKDGEKDEEKESVVEIMTKKN